jgi:eukaryotic-like serine/threonine-protein kinase
VALRAVGKSVKEKFMKSSPKIAEIFSACLERDSRDRIDFLKSQCGGDEILFNRVKKLLEVYEQAHANDFLASSALEIEAENFAACDETDSRIGETLGHYKIIEKIGSGGMGAIYLAERNDEEFQKQVAIKIIKRGMDTNEILRRFRTERQILANLDHPNIARLLDGGTTEDGLPYFVMEYIKGQPIDKYCDENRLSITERLKLFRNACSAVDYAHRNLVIHRDLKPSNILVTKDGTPKLLDFGIAKILRSDTASETTEITETIYRVMTPEYASPEQIKGESVTVSSDVYSLGVLLYQLLTGHRPYKLKSRSPEEIARVICEDEPERPSTAISRIAEVAPTDSVKSQPTTQEYLCEVRSTVPEKLCRQLRGDLDNIVLMALSKNPEERYSSVEEFSLDISRYLEGAPVRARKANSAYQSAAFLKRNVIRNWRLSLALLLSLFVAVASSGFAIYLLKRESETVTATSNIKSIAVLPFKYVGESSSEDNPLLGVGLADFLITQLGQTKKLEVRPISAVQTYSSGNVSPQPIGQSLDVDVVLSGNINRQGENVSINAELISVRDGNVLWKRIFSGKLHEIVSLQNDLSKELSKVLILDLTEAERNTLTNHRTSNAKAYELYVRGRYFWNMRTKNGYERAIEHFNQAIAQDPNYADAYAGLGDAYALLACVMPFDRRPERMQKAKEYAQRALSLDETMASPHATLGFIGWHYDWDWDASDREFKRAIELNPSYATAHQWYALLLVRLNRFDEAIAEMKQARDLDPLSLVMHQDYTEILFYSRRYDEAIEAARKTLELAPESAIPKDWIISSYYSKGDYQECISQMQKLVNEKGSEPDYLKGLAVAYFRLNRKSEGQKILNELKQRGESIELDLWGDYWVYGDTKKMFKWLEDDYKNRGAGVTMIHNHPGWDEIRSHPRIQEYIRLTGLSEYEVKVD